MSNIQKWLMVAAVWVIAVAMLLSAFRGRYQYIMGQNDIHGLDYLPGALDTWTGKKISH